MPACCGSGQDGQQRHRIAARNSAEHWQLKSLKRCSSLTTIKPCQGGRMMQLFFCLGNHDRAGNFARHIVSCAAK